MVDCADSHQVSPGESLLIAGASGAGKTSTLRAIAGLWSAGSGVIRRRGRPVSAGSGGSGDIFFVPQVGAPASGCLLVALCRKLRVHAFRNNPARALRDRVSMASACIEGPLGQS